MTEPGDTSTLKGLQFRRNSEHRDSEYVIIGSKPAYPFVPEEDPLSTNGVSTLPFALEKGCSLYKCS